MIDSLTADPSIAALRALRDSLVAFRPYIEAGLTGRGLSATVSGSEVTMRGAAGTAGVGFQYFATRRTAFDVAKRCINLAASLTYTLCTACITNSTLSAMSRTSRTQSWYVV